MPKSDTKQPGKDHFRIRRVRQELYHVTDNHHFVEYRTSDPSLFRPSKQVILKPTYKKDVDMQQLADALLRLLEDMNQDSE